MVEFSIKNVAMLVLFIMFIAFIYAAFTGWFDSIVSNFLSQVDFDSVL